MGREEREDWDVDGLDRTPVGSWIHNVECHSHAMTSQFSLIEDLRIHLFPKQPP